MRADGYNLNIINPDDQGDLYYATIWRGEGYGVAEYYAYAKDYADAIDEIFAYAYYETDDRTVFDYETLAAWCKDDFNNDNYYGSEPSPRESFRSFEDFEDEWFEDYVANSAMDLFAYKENFFITEVTPEMMED